LTLEEIEEDYRRWRDLPCSWISRINIVKMVILPKAIYMFYTIPIKIPMTFITEFIWKVHLETQETANSQCSTQQKEQCWRYHDTRLQTVLQSNSNKKQRGTGTKTDMKSSGTEDLDMKPHSYAHLIFDKDAKNTQWREDSLFNKCCWEKWLSICKKLKLDPSLSPCTNINSKWIKDLNIRPKTLKLVQERVGNTLEIIGRGKDFLNRIPAAQQLS
jgi:hypothetical protein